MIRQAGKTLGEEGLELAKKLWGRLRPKIEESPEAQSAARVAAKAPEEEARAGLRFQLREILAADPGLASELATLLAAAGAGSANQAAVFGSGAIAQGAGAVAAGAGGVAVGGDVHGDLNAGKGRE